MKKWLIILTVMVALLVGCGSSSGNEDNSAASLGSTSSAILSGASSIPAQSESSGSSEDVNATARTLAGEFFPLEAIVSVHVSDVQVAITVCWDEASMQESNLEGVAQQASSSIYQSMAPLNSVVYIQDDAGNNILTAINGKTTYNASTDNSASGQNPPTISLAEFNEIQEGMTYQEVTDIVGSSGELISETDIGVPEYYTQMRSWDGEGELGANANVIFQGGVVNSKAQFGLK